MARSRCLHAGFILLLALPLLKAARPVEAPTQAAALQPGGALILEHRKEEHPAVAASSLTAGPAALLQATAAAQQTTRQQASPPTGSANDWMDEQWSDEEGQTGAEEALRMRSEQAGSQPALSPQDLDHSSPDQMKGDVEGTLSGPPKPLNPPPLPVRDANGALQNGPPPVAVPAAAAASGEDARSREEALQSADVDQGGLGDAERSWMRETPRETPSEGSITEHDDASAGVDPVAATPPVAEQDDASVDSVPGAEVPAVATPDDASVDSVPGAETVAAATPDAQQPAAPPVEDTISRTASEHIDEYQGRHIAPEDVPRPEDIQRRELFKETEAKAHDLQTAASSIDTTINKVNVAVDKVDGAMGAYHSSINGLSVNFGDLNKMAQDMHGEVLSEFQAREKERMCAFENADRMMRGEPVQPCDGSLGLGDYHAPTSVINNE